MTENPDETAYSLIRDDLSAVTLTCAALHEGVMTAANKLRSASSQRALLVFDTGFEFVYGLLGCFISKVTAIPIAIPKPKTQDLFLHFLKHAQPDTIVTTPALRARLTQLIPDALRPSIVFIELDGKTKTQSLNELPAGDDIAIIQYTSGSTAKPKGVTISFDNLHHNLEAIKNHFGLNKKSVCFSWLPHYHDMGLIDGLLSPLYNQCPGVITSPKVAVANPLVWLKAIEDFRVTHTGGPNFILDLCVDKITQTDAEQLDLSSLSHVYVSAEPVRKSTLERFSNSFKVAGFTSKLFTPGYGLAEATLMVTCKSRNTELTYHTFQNDLKTYVGLGQAIPGIDIQIINPDSGEILQEGQQGEVVLNGPTITRGYFNDEEKTKQVNINLSVDGRPQTYLRTGDIGLLKKGELFITGRLKDTIIVRGVQYFAEDLEYVASAASDYFLKSACAAFSIEKQQTEKIVIVQEIKKGSAYLNSLEATENVRAAIFDHFGLPIESVICVVQGTIPKTTSGKIRRIECKNQYLDGKLNDFLWH